jgi:uncharacterized membrane protein
MKGLIEFAKMTVIGGLLVILPVAVAGMVLAKIVGLLLAVLRPVAAELPGGSHFAMVLAVVVVVGACFVTGLTVQTRVGQRVREIAERRLLERLPGYTLLRSLSRRVAGEEEGMKLAPAMAVIEEALVPAFIVERHADGRYTVFVPAVPTPTVGAVYILPEDRVFPLDVPFATVLKCVSRWGDGAGELLKAMKRA